MDLHHPADHDTSPTRTAAAAAVALVVTIAAVSGCAKTGLPGGGPADDTPPEVTAVWPEPGAVDVDTGAEIRIEFSEEMERQSVEKLLTVSPGVALHALSWRGRELTARPREPLPDDETIVVSLARGSKDYHGVSTPDAFEFAFSTGTTVDDGKVAGRVVRDGEPVTGAKVWACRERARSDTTGTLARCGYEAITGEDGRFEIRHVAPADSAYTLIAFLDSDRNGAYEERTETGAVVPEAAAVLAPGDSAGGIVIPVSPPESDGGQAGEGS